MPFQLMIPVHEPGEAPCKRKRLGICVLLDPNGDFKRAMNVGPIPQTFLINGKGEIVWTHTSFSDGAELDLIKHVRQLVAGEEIK